MCKSVWSSHFCQYVNHRSFISPHPLFLILQENTVDGEPLHQNSFLQSRQSVTSRKYRKDSKGIERIMSIPSHQEIHPPIHLIPAYIHLNGIYMNILIGVQKLSRPAWVRMLTWAYSSKVSKILLTSTLPSFRSKIFKVRPQWWTLAIHKKFTRNSQEQFIEISDPVGFDSECVVIKHPANSPPLWHCFSVANTCALNMRCWPRRRNHYLRNHFSYLHAILLSYYRTSWEIQNQRPDSDSGNFACSCETWSERPCCYIRCIYYIYAIYNIVYTSTYCIVTQ